MMQNFVPNPNQKTNSTNLSNSHLPAKNYAASLINDGLGTAISEHLRIQEYYLKNGLLTPEETARIKKLSEDIFDYYGDEDTLELIDYDEPELQKIARRILAA